MAERRDWAEERVLRFLAEASGRPVESILPNEPLAAFEIDSLEEVELVMELEDEYGVEIPDPKMPLTTVASLIEWIRSAPG